MIGGHYPAVFATEYAWIILALVLVMGAVIRHFFNTKHKGQPAPWWTWIVAAALTVGAIFLSHAGAPVKYDQDAYAEYEFGEGAELHLAAVELVTERCAICHARAAMGRHGLPAQGHGSGNRKRHSAADG